MKLIRYQSAREAVLVIDAMADKRIGMMIISSEMLNGNGNVWYNRNTERERFTNLTKKLNYATIIGLNKAKQGNPEGIPLGKVGKGKGGFKFR